MNLILEGQAAKAAEHNGMQKSADPITRKFWRIASQYGDEAVGLTGRNLSGLADATGDVSRAALHRAWARAASEGASSGVSTSGARHGVARALAKYLGLPAAGAAGVVGGNALMGQADKAGIARRLSRTLAGGAAGGAAGSLVGQYLAGGHPFIGAGVGIPTGMVIADLLKGGPIADAISKLT